MSNNRFSKPIYFQEDLVKEYAKKRKALNESDVKDLLRCLVKFIAEDTENYAYSIPHIGQIHTAFEIGDNTDFFYEQKMTDAFFSNKKIIKKEILDRHGRTKQELQDFQNEIFNNNTE